MIGIDTNILLRWVVDDGLNRKQVELATEVMVMASIHLSIVTLLEVQWVLRSFYKFPQTERLEVVDRLLAVPNVVVQHADAITTALADCRAYGGDLPDHLLASFNEDAGCDYTLTFDTKASRSPKFRKFTA